MRNKIFGLVLITIIFSSANLVFAADNPIDDSPVNNAGWHLVPDCEGDTCDWGNLIALANKIVIFLVWLSASLATLAFCYAGFLYLTAFGEMGKIEQAHSIFKSAIIGIFFVLCGWLIVATILKMLVGGADNAEINKIVPFDDVQDIPGQ